jgi:hypothetical protein
MPVVSSDLILISIQVQIASKCFYVIDFEHISHFIFSSSSLSYRTHRSLRERKKKRKNRNNMILQYNRDKGKLLVSFLSLSLSRYHESDRENREKKRKKNQRQSFTIYKLSSDTK